MEIDLGRLGGAADGGGGAEMRGGGQRDVALAGEEPGGGIEPDPAGAGQVDLGPGVEVGEIGFGALGAVERLDIGLHLDQVARDEAGGIAKLAQHLNLQPGAVAAGTGAEGQRFLGVLNTGLHADDIADAADQRLIEGDEEVDRAARPAGELGDQRVELGTLRFRAEIGGEVFVRVRVDEEVEGVDHRQLRQQIDLHGEVVDGIGEHHPRLPVAVRILLPIQEMFGRADLQRIVGHRRAAVRCRAQADDLGTEPDGPAVAITGEVMEAGLDHGLVVSPFLVQCNKNRLRRRARGQARRSMTGDTATSLASSGGIGRS